VGADPAATSIASLRAVAGRATLSDVGLKRKGTDRLHCAQIIDGSPCGRAAIVASAGVAAVAAVAGGTVAAVAAGTGAAGRAAQGGVVGKKSVGEARQHAQIVDRAALGETACSAVTAISAVTARGRPAGTVAARATVAADAALSQIAGEENRFRSGTENGHGAIAVETAPLSRTAPAAITAAAAAAARAFGVIGRGKAAEAKEAVASLGLIVDDLGAALENHESAHIIVDAAPRRLTSEPRERRTRQIALDDRVVEKQRSALGIEDAAAATDGASDEPSGLTVADDVI